MPISPPAAWLDSAAGRRAAWVLDRAVQMASGRARPDESELSDHYTETWLSDVPPDVMLRDAAAAVSGATNISTEPSPAREARALLGQADGRLVRFRCVVDDAPPHRIAFQLFSPAVDPSGVLDRRIDRDGRSVHVQDFGGDGPLLLLWHGAGCDSSVWEAMVPYLGEFHVIAQDLPGHGASWSSRFSVADAVADGRAVVDELALGEPVVVGHSMGGWAALHYAATSPCRALVCLDGPTSLDGAATNLPPEHHAFVPDPPDVAADVGLLDCPTMLVLCRGTSEAEEERMVPFRAPLSDFVAVRHRAIRVEWRSAGHLLVVSQPEETADLVGRFLRDAIG